MKLYDGGTTILIIIAVAALVGYGSHKLLKMKDDNVIEETSEKIIEEHTGFDIDLSPGSPEVDLFPDNPLNLIPHKYNLHHPYVCKPSLELLADTEEIRRS